MRTHARAIGETKQHRTMREQKSRPAYRPSEEHGFGNNR